MFRTWIPIITGSLFTGMLPLLAQVHEADEPVDLAKGLALKQDVANPGANPSQTQVGAKDFAIAMTVTLPSPLAETLLAGQSDDAAGWRLLVTADGALRFEARANGKPDPFAVSTTPSVVAAGSTHHVALNIVRDSAKPNGGIWLDGIELASGIVPPADLSAPQPFAAAAGATHLRLYQRALSRPEMLALWLEPQAPDTRRVVKHSDPPRDGPRFIPQQDETIALIGGTEAVALAESGEFEALMLMAFPESHFRFRNLAWEGDTVFHQDRPMNFGDLSQQLRRIHAGTVLMVFGRQEALDLSSDGLGDFEKAFNKLLADVQACTPNVIVAAPPTIYPVPGQPALSASLAEARKRLVQCCEIMQKVAAKRGAIYLKSDRPDIADGPPRSRDGVTLTSAGVLEYSVALTSGLGLPTYAKSDAPAGKKVVEAVRAKNRLWHNYWRPTNWAFLHGDRTQQPSSRDPVNPQLRFFPGEQEKYLPLIKDAEERAFKLAGEATKKLP